MKRYLAFFSSLVISTLAIPAMAQTPQSGKPLTPLEQTLIDSSKTIPEALKTKNVDLLKRTLADSFYGVGSEGALHHRDEVIDAAAEGILKDYTVYNASVFTVDADSAIVTYNLIVNMPEGDTDLAPRYQRVSDLWVKSGEQWKLKFQQATPLRAID
ncbi:MAG: nuclear transport factor 2 family protein [Acidobacteriota bacterium]|nr:nuclear transport factor 2 family protein [Acidobacteriota bacterium]